MRWAYLQVLHQIVKHPQAFWVFTVLDVDQRTNFCRLKRERKGGESRQTLKAPKGRGGRKKNPLRAYFERDVIISDADLQLLLPDDIFLWPVCVVFPLMRRNVIRVCPEMGGKRILDDLALLDYALQLLYYKRADPH
jgi:hypothetical protein